MQSIEYDDERGNSYDLFREEVFGLKVKTKLLEMGY